MPKPAGHPIGWNGPATVNSGPNWSEIQCERQRSATFKQKSAKRKVSHTLQLMRLTITGDFLNELENEISLISPDLKKKELTVAQTAPGRYELDFPTQDVGPYFLNIMQRQAGEIVNTQVTGTVVSYPQEYLVHNANDSLLTQLAAVSGGKFNASPADAFRSA